MKKVSKDEVAEGVTPLLSAIFALSGIVSNGIGTFTLSSFSLSDPVFSAGGQSITVASILALVTMSLAYGVNNNDVSEFSDAQTYISGLGVFAVFATGFVPAISSFVTGSLAIGGIVFVIECLAFAFVAGYNG